MTRLFTCGFEFNSLSEQGMQSLRFADQGHAIVTSGSPGPSSARSGTYCFQTAIDRFDSRYTFLRKTLGGSVSEVYTRAAIWPSGMGNLGSVELVRVLDAGSTQVLSIRTSSTGVLTFYASTGVNGAAGSSPLVGDTWNVLEYRYKPDTGTAGLLTVWLNNVEVYSITGVKTSGGQSNCLTFDWGMYCVTGGSAFAYYYYDDIAINSTAGSVNNGRTGDGKVVLLKPNGAGSSTVLTRGGTDSGANWSQVDEIAPTMTDYVYSASEGARDLYAAADLPAEALTINVVEAHAFAQNADAGAGALGLTIKSGPAMSEATSQPLTTTAAYYRAAFEIDPNTGLSWTPIAVNAAEVGVTVR